MIICVTVIVWIVLAFVLNKTIDAFYSKGLSDIPEGVLVSDSLRNQGAIIVVVIIGCVLFWMFAASFMRERQEVPLGF